ncbi:ethionine resistance protein [Spiromyces aspiralis]|uniref:Ethionine resistance protein n=1 Tax=Spiromyces aspiralis TaxID=68401 RepID=A0ACC1HCK0_9FUNG|nr:ethionine resistance protein [Spiromyces aspiralis]
MTYVCQYSFMFVNTLALGHLGPKELGSALLAITTASVVASAPAVGYAGALDTFCSTAFTASADKHIVGFHLQRGLLAALIHYCAIFPFLWNAEPLMILLRQDPEVSRLCGRFLRVHIFGMLPWMVFECLKRFVQAQGDMKASTKLLLYLTPFHALITYTLVLSPQFGLGFIGSPLATCITNWLMLFGLVLHIAFGRAREAWGGFDYRCVYGISEFYRLALPSVIMTCCDWWAFELLSVGASYLGNLQLAAQSIILNTDYLFYQIPAGMGAAVSARVGNFLGAGMPRTARMSMRVSFVIGLAISGLTVVAMILAMPWWAAIYTTDSDLIKLVTSVLPIVIILQIFVMLNAICLGILRSMGHQRTGALLSIPLYTLIMLPLGFYLSYSTLGLGIAGFWIGMVVGTIAIVASLLFFIFKRVDWDDEVLACIARLKPSARHHNQQLALVVGDLQSSTDLSTYA